MPDPAVTLWEDARSRGGLLRLPVALLETIARRLFLALIRLYFPRRTVDGTGRLPPPGTPAVYLANHPNGLLDPLVLCVAVDRPVRFLAKSTLFGNPLSRLAMNALGCLRVFRPRDLRPDERDQAGPRNEATFAACRRILAEGGELALFPEGTSHSDPRLRPLKTGAARIALSTVAETGVVPVLVPCGLHYEDPARFRSGVHVTVGEPSQSRRGRS